MQAGTWVENTAMRRVLEKLGYHCEGVMREFMPADEGRMITPSMPSPARTGSSRAIARLQDAPQTERPKPSATARETSPSVDWGR